MCARYRELASTGESRSTSAAPCQGNRLAVRSTPVWQSQLLAEPIKPQTERQLSRHLTENSTDTATFLLKAAQLLEEYELDILFAPQFTPEMSDQAAVSDLLYHWRPDTEELERLAPDLCRQVKHAVLLLAGDIEAKLTLHEVMVDRFVSLLHHAARAALVASKWPR